METNRLAASPGSLRRGILAALAVFSRLSQ